MLDNFLASSKTVQRPYLEVQEEIPLVLGSPSQCPLLLEALRRLAMKTQRPFLTEAGHSVGFSF